MCTLVAIGVTGYRGDVIGQFRKYALHAAPSTNPTARALPGDARFAITAGGCSCDFYSGESAPPSFNEPQVRRRLERRGWKAPRVERELAALRAKHDAALNRPCEETSFVAAVRALISEGAKVSLLAHRFRGDFDEPFEIAGTTELPLGYFSSSGGDFPADRVVTLIC